MYDIYYDPPYLMHHGIKGMRWGVRRYQNRDGSLTSAGRNRYDSSNERGGLSKRAMRKAERQKRRLAEQQALDKWLSGKKLSDAEKRVLLGKRHQSDKDIAKFDEYTSGKIHQRTVNDYNRSKLAAAQKAQNRGHFWPTEPTANRGGGHFWPTEPTAKNYETERKRVKGAKIADKYLRSERNKEKASIAKAEKLISKGASTRQIEKEYAKASKAYLTRINKHGLDPVRPLTKKDLKDPKVRQELKELREMELDDEFEEARDRRLRMEGWY